MSVQSVGPDSKDFSLPETTGLPKNQVSDMSCFGNWDDDAASDMIEPISPDARERLQRYFLAQHINPTRQVWRPTTNHRRGRHRCEMCHLIVEHADGYEWLPPGVGREHAIQWYQLLDLRHPNCYHFANADAKRCRVGCHLGLLASIGLYHSSTTQFAVGGASAIASRHGARVFWCCVTWDCSCLLGGTGSVPPTSLSAAQVLSPCQCRR